MASTYEERLSPETMRAKEEFIANLAEEKALAELRGNHETVLRLYGEFVAALRQETGLD